VGADLLPDGPLVVPGLAAVAENLEAIGYRPDRVSALLGVGDEIPVNATDAAIYQRRLAANPGALADLVAVFALGGRRPVDRIAAALGSAGMDMLLTAGVLVEADGWVLPAIRLMPHGELWIAADRHPLPGEAPAALHVTGINAPATLLAALTVRRDGSTALDVGTGNGIQALLLAQHSERVIATDINPRALAYAAFNAALNGVENLECREGNLLEPVAGERFDVLVSNPPYVISPDVDYAYRDSGQEPGALCAALVHALPEHLNDHGHATVLASWPISASRHWSDVPRDWLGHGCRAWLLQLSVTDVLRHAAQWNAPLAIDGDAAGYGEAIDRWVRYAEERGIEQIGYGAVIVTPRDGEPVVVRADEMRAGRGNAGAHIERVFAAYDLLAGRADDAALTALTCHVPAGHQVERRIHFVDGSWRQGNAVVTLSEGVGIEATLDPLMTEVFLRVTSGLSVSAAANEAGQFAGVTFEQLGDLVAASADMIRELLAIGIVTADADGRVDR
jgi:methylase of polypeptide subunit release factors